MNVMEEGKGLDEEWVRLIQCAKEMGLTPDKVREFIQQTTTKKHPV